MLPLVLQWMKVDTDTKLRLCGKYQCFSFHVSYVALNEYADGASSDWDRGKSGLLG